MEDPFYPAFWSTRPRAGATAMAKPSRPAKVVSVPVHFVSSDETKPPIQSHTPTAADAAVSRTTERITKPAAALAIQRAYRGFLVRKNLRAVRRIEAEVDAVEREVTRAGDRLRRDARERLRVSETLMSLLFRLDSVRGVRDYRRRVIRRAIALQEAVDAIAAGEESVEGAAAPDNDVGGRSEGCARGETLEEQSPLPMVIPEPMDSDVEALGDHGGSVPSSRDEDSGKKAHKEDSSTGEVVAEEFKQEEGEGEGEGAGDSALEDTQEPSMDEDLGTQNASEKGSDTMAMGDASEDHNGDQLGNVTQAPMSQYAACGQVKAGDSPATSEMGSCQPASALALDVAEGQAGQGCGDGMRQVMERMVEESKGLKGLVAELCERNEMQLRLMDGLLQRVERLEKVVEKMRRSKKQKRQDAKKCCARKCEKRL